MVEIRLAEERDRLPLALLFAAVAEERDGIASEPPVDVERRAVSWSLEHMFVAVGDGEPVGLIRLIDSGWGYAEIAMLVAAAWRGRGVGSALLAAAIESARESEFHKLTLSVFPHNEAGLALYRKFGFVEEGYRPKQLRRQSGELWDLVDMGLILAP